MAIETITNLTIKGYKSIQNLADLELRSFNVLIGANGSGKSNFIDFFRMLSFMFQSTDGSLQQFVAQNGYANSLLYYGSKTTRYLDASMIFEHDTQWSKYSFRLSWGAPDELHYDNELLEYQLDSDRKQMKLGNGYTESKVLKLAGKQPDLPLDTVSRVFRNRLRQIRVYHFHDTSDRSGIRVSQGFDRDDLLTSNADNIAVFLYNLKENEPAYYKHILNTIRIVAPFINDFIVEPRSTGDRTSILRWRDRSGDIFGPHQLSDGTIRAIALITALLQPEHMMPSIMLFDEPELGLHPAAINLIAELLKGAAEKRQIIVATQSPILISQYEPEDIIVIERSENADFRGSSTFTRLHKGPLEKWLEDYDLGELYQKNVTGGYPK